MYVVARKERIQHFRWRSGHRIKIFRCHAVKSLTGGFERVTDTMLGGFLPPSIDQAGRIVFVDRSRPTRQGLVTAAEPAY